MTAPETTQDEKTVAVGLIADPFITSGPWVVHPYWDSLPPGSGVPLHDIPCKPVPVRKSQANPSPRSPFSFTANNCVAHPGRLRLTPLVTSVVSLIVAVILAGSGVALVWLTARVVDAGNTITVSVLFAAALCGLMLLTAAVMDRRGRR